MDKESAEQRINNYVKNFISLMNSETNPTDKHWKLEEHRDNLWYYLGYVIQELRKGGNNDERNN